MASKSFINLCTSLTISWFCGERVLDKCPESDPGCRKVRRIAHRCIDLSRAARQLWPDCDRKEAMQVQNRVAAFESNVLHGHGQITQMISVGIGLLQDALPNLRGARAASIDQLADCMDRLLREFDRNLEDVEVYDKAIDNLKGWYRINQMETFT